VLGAVNSEFDGWVKEKRSTGGKKPPCPEKNKTKEKSRMVPSAVEGGRGRGIAEHEKQKKITHLRAEAGGEGQRDS